MINSIEYRGDFGIYGHPHCSSTGTITDDCSDYDSAENGNLCDNGDGVCIENIFYALEEEDEVHSCSSKLH